MLTSLAIRDIVLIERLDLAFEPGLCVLTGETGAGKSILLDALGLALGGRADRDLVRRGAAQASVSAVFAPAAGDPVEALLAEHGIAAEDDLVLRRVVGADGRSRGFVNDQPVGTGLMRQIGGLLIEVHGQHEQQGLFDPAIQRGLLDAYGGLEGTAAELRQAHGRWRALERSRAGIAAQLERTAAEEDYLRHVLAELEALAPEPDEEEALAALRARLMDREKLTAAIGEALALLRDQGGVEGRLGSARRVIERICERAGDTLEAAAAALDRAGVELAEADAALERAGHELAHGDERLEQVEERLFALRAAGRKHRLAVADLPGLRDETAARLAAIDAGGERLTEAANAAAQAREAVALHCRAAVGRAPQGGDSARQGRDGRAAAAQARQGELRGPPGCRCPRRSGRRTAPSAWPSRSRPTRARSRGRSPRSPPAASSRASCWRSRWSSRGWARCRRWCSTRSIPASAAPRPPRSASAWSGWAARCRCWW